MALQVQVSADRGRMNLDSGQACRSKVCHVGECPLSCSARLPSLLQLICSLHAMPGSPQPSNRRELLLRL